MRRPDDSSFSTKNYIGEAMPTTGALKDIDDDMSLNELRDADQISATTALRFVVRDMGNGVKRLENAYLVPIEQARIESELSDRTPLLFPHPDEVLDFAFEALRSIGVRPDLSPKRIRKLFARAIDDYTVEIVGWRQN
jgi:hypothetical protein